MNRVDHFYSIWHRPAGEKPGFGARVARANVQNFIRYSGIIATVVEEAHQVGMMERIDTLVEHAENCPCLECTGVEPSLVPYELDPLDYYRAIIDHGGGIITLGEGLGVLIGPDYTYTPAGWLYVPIGSVTTPEQLKHWVDAVRTGRSDWPSKEVLR
jgi:hypothetical protein